MLAALEDSMKQKHTIDKTNVLAVGVMFND